MKLWQRGDAASSAAPQCEVAGCRSPGACWVRLSRRGVTSELLTCELCAEFMQAGCDRLGYRVERLERMLFLVP